MPHHNGTTRNRPPNAADLAAARAAAGPPPTIYVSGPELRDTTPGPYWSAHACTAGTGGPTFTIVATWPTEPDQATVRSSLVEAIKGLAGYGDRAEVRSEPGRGAA